MSPDRPRPRIGQEGLELDTTSNFQQEPSPAEDLRRPTALVHILTPEFHGFNPEDFNYIPDDVVARASAQDLQPSLFWAYVPKNKRQAQEVSAYSYQTADEGVMSVALTPQEYNTASESVDKLAQRMLSRVLTQRDAALRKRTGNDNARARSNEDLRIARRGAMRKVMERQTVMENLLEEGILPKIELIEKFREMTDGRSPNLSRGTRATVSKRFEELRNTVFDDMLDAIALQRDWTADMSAKAKRVIQKRLYISGTSTERVTNFREMIALASAYYGHKRALILTKIEDAKRYQRANPAVVTDISIVDEQRRREKKTGQLSFED